MEVFVDASDVQDAMVYAAPIIRTVLHAEGVNTADMEMPHFDVERRQLTDA